MKTLIIIAALLSLSAFAQEGKPAAAAPEVAPAKVEKVAKKAHHKITKAAKKDAKEACLQENPTLKQDKKALKECIKGKM